jgi:exosortase
MSKLALTDWKSNLPRFWILIGWLVLIGIFLWSYGAVIVRLVGWWCRPDYGHGFFVPIFALVLLLARGRMIAGESKDEASKDGDWWLHLLWNNGDWVKALLRSKITWSGVIAGAAVAAPVYAAYFPHKGPGAWPEILLAACYGGVLGALVLLIAELFQHSPADARQSADWTWWAMGFFAVWALMRLISACLVMERTDEWSILLFAAGVAMFFGGWRALRWSWPSIVFLYFMTPLPGAVQGRLGPFLQGIATWASVYAIQTLGIPSARGGADGNVIQLPAAQLKVAEACSGLRMLMLFFAICVGAAFLLRCPLWKKVVIVISAIPIAIFSNVTRIAVTAILYEMARRWPTHISEETANWVFHNGAGWLMMPYALLLLLVLWKLLAILVVEQVSGGPLVLSGSLAKGSAAADSRSTTNP